MLEQVLPLQRFFPPGLAADSIASALHGDFVRALGAVVLQCFYSAIISGAAQYPPSRAVPGRKFERGGRAHSQTRRRGAAPAVGWNIPGVPGPISAIVEKEFHYLSRSGPMLFTFIMPVVVLVIFRFGSARTGDPGGILARASDLAFPVGAAYILLMLTNLVYNTFGGDGVGVQFFFLAPVRFREIVLGKNLAHAIIMAIEILSVLAGHLFSLPPAFRARSLPPPSPASPSPSS